MVVVRILVIDESPMGLSLEVDDPYPHYPLTPFVSLLLPFTFLFWWGNTIYFIFTNLKRSIEITRVNRTGRDEDGVVTWLIHCPKIK